MGKTKDVTINNDGTCTFRFKDDVTADENGFNPGANQVGLKIDGMGRASMLLSQHFFPIIRASGIPTHNISFDIEAGTMTAHKLAMFSIEVVWRKKAWGSFSETYGIERGYPLDGLIEATLKNDDLGDPRINKEALVKLKFITAEQYDICDNFTRRIGDVLQSELAEFGYELIDFKVEFGINENGEIMLADEISGGIWRLFKDGKSVDPIVAAKTICPEYY